MNILKFLQEEGFSRVSYSTEGHNYMMNLNEAYQLERIIEDYDETSCTVEYFPFEMKPYMTFIQRESYWKIFLYK